MGGLFLTPEQLVELTHRERPAWQRKALAAMGVPYRTRPDGTPAVLAAHLDARPEARVSIQLPKLNLKGKRHGKAASNR